MKNILIALDYDPTAQKVAEIGSSDATITLLHLIADPSYYTTTVYDPIMGFGGYTNLNLLVSDIINELKKTSMEFFG